jgi:acetyl-CoA acetyltransferase
MTERWISEYERYHAGTVPAKRRGPAAATEPTARDAEIVSLRNAGMTLEALAQKHNVTRERIRQICVRWHARTADDLHRSVIDARRVTWECAQCGKKRRLPPHKAATLRYCSARCTRYGINGNSHAAVMARAEKALQLRMAGAKWHDVGVSVGISKGTWTGMHAQRLVRFYGSELNIDVSSAFHRTLMGAHLRSPEWRAKHTVAA